MIKYRKGGIERSLLTLGGTKGLEKINVTCNDTRTWPITVVVQALHRISYKDYESHSEKGEEIWRFEDEEKRT